MISPNVTTEPVNIPSRYVYVCVDGDVSGVSISEVEEVVEEVEEINDVSGGMDETR